MNINDALNIIKNNIQFEIYLLKRYSFDDDVKNLSFEDFSTVDTTEYSRIMNLNEILLKKFPVIYEQDKILTKPVNFINGKTVEVVTYDYEYQNSFDFYLDIRKECNDNEEAALKEYHNIVSRSLKLELEKLMLLANTGYHAYIPVSMVKRIQKDTFQPMIGFQSKYAVI